MPPLVLACGALAQELRVVLADQLTDGAVEIDYLPANLHNRPEKIVPSLRPRLRAAVDDGRHVFVAYADCGTGGMLDALLEEFPGVGRLPGAHCYEVFAGARRFAELHDDEPGTFYLTDFLAKHFEALVWEGLGLDRHPQLRPMYFGNYSRIVLLAQRPSAVVVSAARAAAERLELAFEHHETGLTPFRQAIGIPVGVTRKAA